MGGQARNRIARLNPDGSLDASFDPNANHWVYSLAVQPDGKILLGGAFTQMGGQARSYIARLYPDGSLDTAFNPQANGYITTLAVQPDGKILLGGDFTSIGGQGRNHIARLNPDGSLDTAFNPGSNGGVNSMLVQADGKILIGGGFTFIGGQGRNRIARLHPNGSIDTSFNPDANAVVYALAAQADGKILAGGMFTGIGGEARVRLARLTNDTAAWQDLSVTPDGQTISWMRRAASPEVGPVSFEQSPDGVTYSPLGSGTSIPGGWQLTGLNLPPYQNLFIRARGYYGTGLYNGSISATESVRNVYAKVPPTAITIPATGITTSAAILNGTVNPNGASTSYYFQWGTSTAYGSTTPNQSAGSGTTDVNASAPINGLTPNTTYHFQLVAFSNPGTIYGGDQTFQTSVAPLEVFKVHLPIIVR